MDNKEIFNDLSKYQAGVLALVAWADGKITPEEKDFFSEIIDMSPCDEGLKQDLLKFLEKPPKIEEIVDSTIYTPKEIVVPVLKNAYLIAVADGSIDDSEKEIIRKISDKIGITKDNEEIFWQWLDLYHKCDMIEEKLFG